MITLNTNKGLIKVEDWSDIESRAGFVGDLNPKDHTLDAIIGRYIFGDKIRCGLSNCHSPHAKGYIVSTKSGLETNIGKDCGSAYFGVDFNTLSKQFDRDVEESENREALWSFSGRVEELEKRIKALRQRDKGADWAYKTSRPLVEAHKGCPTDIVRAVTNMVKTKNGALVISREATPKELERDEELQGKKLPQPHYVHEQVGQIEAVEALYPENDVRNILVINVSKMLSDFKALSIDKMTFEQLKKWIKWTRTVEPNMELAEASLASAGVLLRAENLKCLNEILTDPKDKTMFSGYLKTL